MKKQIVYFLIIVLCGCATKKNVPNNFNSNKEVSASESNLYFEADKARILGDYAKAKPLFVECLKINPQNAAAQYFYGNILQREGVRATSLEHLKAAYNLEKNNSVYEEAYATALMYNGSTAQGANMLINLSNKHRAQSQDYLYKALYLSEQNNNLSKAIEIANIIEKKHGFDDEMANRKIRIFDKQNNSDAMLAEIDKLIQFDANEHKYYLAKMELCKELGKINSVDSLALILENKFLNEPDAVRLLLKHAKDKGNKERMQKFTKSALANNNVDALAKMEILWPSVREAEKDSSLRPEVLQNFQKIYSQASSNNLVAIAYANILTEFGKTKEAITVFKTALNVDSSSLEAWQAVITLHLNLTENDSAIAVFKRALKVFPNEANLYLYGGQAYLMQEKIDSAIVNYKKGLLLAKPNSTVTETFYGSLADAYNTKKMYALSDSFFNAALIINPSNASNLNNYAYYLSIRNERLTEAATMSIKSLQLVPNNKTFLDTYAWILYKQNKLDLAQQTMQQALDAEGSNDAVMLEHYGDILYKQNKINEAIVYWKQAQQLNPKLTNIENKITNKKIYE